MQHQTRTCCTSLQQSARWVITSPGLTSFQPQKAPLPDNLHAEVSTGLDLFGQFLHLGQAHLAVCVTDPSYAADLCRNIPSDYAL